MTRITHSTPLLSPGSRPADPNAFHVHVATARMLGMAFFGALMTAACVWCAQLPGLKPQLAGVVGIPFFGLGTFYIIWQVSRMEPAIVIDAAGVDYRLLGVGVVPWSEVIDVGVGEVRGQKVLCFSLVDETPYRANLPWHRRQLAAANAVMGFPLLTMSFTGMDRSLNDALRAIDHLRAIQAVESRTTPNKAM